MSVETFEVKFYGAGEVRDNIEVELIRIQAGKSKLKPTWKGCLAYPKETSVVAQVEALKQSHGEIPTQVVGEPAGARTGSRWACGCVTLAFYDVERVWACSDLHAEIYAAWGRVAAEVWTEVVEAAGEVTREEQEG